MKNTDKKIIQSYTGVDKERKISHTPAKLDFIQSVSGAFLALFMIAHMFLVSSILLGPEAMYKVTKFLELNFIFDGGGAWAVSVFAVIIIAALIIHAFLAIRKFPINYKQFIALKVHKNLMKHGDTTYWAIQACTGFALFFLTTIHLYVMLTKPDTIGPNASAYRFVSENFWLVYIFLLVAVELHGSIGLYRLCVKWGFFQNLGIKALRTIKVGMSIFFIVLGLCTYYAYMKIGLSHDNSQDMKYYQELDKDLYGAQNLKSGSKFSLM